MNFFYILNSKRMTKQVSFNLNNNQIFTTHNKEDYDRSQIDHVLYRKAYNRISDKEIDTILINLDLYKLYEMPINKESLHNNTYSSKNFTFRSK